MCRKVRSNTGCIVDAPRHNRGVLHLYIIYDKTGTFDYGSIINQANFEIQ